MAAVCVAEVENRSRVRGENGKRSPGSDSLCGSFLAHLPTEGKNLASVTKV